jgi:hypothetical protein
VASRRTATGKAKAQLTAVIDIMEDLLDVADIAAAEQAEKLCAQSRT